MAQPFGRSLSRMRRRSRRIPTSGAKSRAADSGRCSPGYATIFIGMAASSPRKISPSAQPAQRWTWGRIWIIFAKSMARFIGCRGHTS